MLLGLPSLLLLTGIIAAQSERSFRWDELQKQGRVSSGAVLPPDTAFPFHRLRVERHASEPTNITVLTIDRPSVAGPRYSLSGQVRHDGVEGTAYLEMWNYFPDGGQYFSRTLAEQGPMMKLHGSSGWRPFVLPFDATGAPPPTRLVLNVVFQGGGTVYLGPLELREEKGAPVGASGGLTPDRIVGIAGGIGGGVIGSIGALIGVLTSLGRARRFVMASAASLIVFGALAFLAGLISLMRSQPLSLVSPLLLFGFLAAVVPLGLLPTIKKHYEEIEFRAMHAQDVA